MKEGGRGGGRCTELWSLLNGGKGTGTDWKAEALNQDEGTVHSVFSSPRPADSVTPELTEAQSPIQVTEYKQTSDR